MSARAQNIDYFREWLTRHPDGQFAFRDNGHAYGYYTTESGFAGGGPICGATGIPPATCSACSGTGRGNLLASGECARCLGKRYYCSACNDVIQAVGGKVSKEAPW